MREISRSTGSGSLIPSDLRIRLPQVEGHNLERPIEFFPLQAGNRKLHQGGGLRIRERRRRELHLSAEAGELPPVPQRAVPDEDDLLAAGLELRYEAVR